MMKKLRIMSYVFPPIPNHDMESDFFLYRDSDPGSGATTLLLSLKG